MKLSLYKSLSGSQYQYEKLKEIENWIDLFNKNTFVDIEKTKLLENDFWFFDKKEVLRNKNNSFFSIQGIKGTINDEIFEQPIIIQNEIGYLGIICKEINGVMHFLMQAKIEPGNVNKVQISPTIQATKSNFTRQHGGKTPEYLDYFINASNYNIIVDQIQSEQASRFFRKRNRNIIIEIEEEIEITYKFKWMTLWQIKQLLKINNLVNMDTRTVISCIPFDDILDKISVKSFFSDIKIYNSIFNDSSIELSKIYNKVNDYKMFKNSDVELVGLNELTNWICTNEGIKSIDNSNFEVIFCDIKISNREVSQWKQPIVASKGKALFGLFVASIDNKKMFLVKLKPEIGSFDSLELGPTVQLESNNSHLNKIDEIFTSMHKSKSGILYDVILSEEGGRFYHEENINVIIEIEANVIEKLPEDYFWLDLKTLFTLIKINNCLNIQLRNLLSLLEM